MNDDILKNRQAKYYKSKKMKYKMVKNTFHIYLHVILITFRCCKFIFRACRESQTRNS